MIVFGAVDEEHHVGILLDGSRLTQVAELRTLSFESLARLNATVKLAERENGNVEFLGKSLQRSGYCRYLLLSAAEAHTVGVHQLQIVNHNQFHTMFSHQSACLCAQLKHRESGSVVNIERCSNERVDTLVEAVPFVGFKLSVENLASLNFTAVGDESVDELDVAHLKREEGCGYTIVGNDVFCHGEGKRGLSHGRSACNDDEVGRLPTAGDVVELVVACRYSRESVFVCRRFLNNINGICYDRVYLCVVLLHVSC